MGQNALFPYAIQEEGCMSMPAKKPVHGMHCMLVCACVSEMQTGVQLGAVGACRDHGLQYVSVH